jgi:hypothetical protein
MSTPPPRARLEELRAVGQREREAIPLPEPDLLKDVGRPAGPFVELAVGQAPLAVHDRDRVWLLTSVCRDAQSGHLSER